jgi:hypothetical protein
MSKSGKIAAETENKIQRRTYNWMGFKFTRTIIFYH